MTTEWETTTTLVEAKDWLRDRLEEGAHCPCCTQLAKVYKRPIHAAMARDLITAWRLVGMDEWFNIRTDLGFNRGSSDTTKLRYWGLIEEAPDEREDGSSRAGWWKITRQGEAFIHNRLRVPKYAHIYDGKLQRLSGDPTSIMDALHNRFDYHELMSR